MLLGAIICSFLVAELRGGRIRNLARADFRRLEWVLVAGLIHVGLQVAGGRGWIAPAWWTGLLNVLGYFLAMFALASNLRLPGMRLVGVGLLLNLAVIAANGGRMPVSAAALQAVGLGRLVPALASGDVPTHTLMGDHTRLAFLGDVFRLPPPYWRPCAFSLGDAVLAVGAFLLIQGLMGAGRPNRPA
ncbi:MAG: DUF5317 domain-containing protein [Bacillota bacterium]|nr:DUF5317 domain-containing protein [Bacillota bacterium]